MGHRAQEPSSAQVEAGWHPRSPGLSLVAIAVKLQSTHRLPAPDVTTWLTQSPQKKDAKDSKSAQRKPPTPEEMDTLKLKKAWEVALGPIKSLPMTAIMMYMSGNSLQIFSIMMVFMAFKNPIMGILATNQAFERFETETNKAKIVQVKLAYVVMQLVALALGIWKVNSMGLLP